MIRKIARPMLASVYVLDGADTLLNTDAHVEGTETLLKRVRSVLPRRYAKKLPRDPELVTRVVGGTKVGAGSLLALGKAPRFSAATLALLTAPTILARHAFWETQDKEEKQARRNGFITNIALLGGLAITSVDTAGKPGLKWRATKAAEVANKKVHAALPTKSETEKTTEQLTGTAQEWLDDASTKVGEYAHKAQDYYEDNKEDWLTTAQVGAAKVGEYAHLAQDYWKGNKDDWLTAAQDNAKTARSGAVKAATKAQERANTALARAEDASGRAKKRADKEAGKFQERADQAIARAQRKIGDLQG
ncbi:DoxX [Corynebacterium occultum]|uniref:DoxX n=1 Tax=Corynebacterium occultum TaxID=2675219 RepID=A0A6B8W8L2_9CORY|nr:DoxX family protein [Corynebacterium occultum]QGU07246.1 DoxX [Corynebacterium occultum]